jgi:predicted Zn-dependent peptidase
MTFPKAGSSNEMVGEAGAALMNKCMSFKSGSRISTLMINRTIEDDGGVPFCTADRNGAVLGYTVLPDKAVGLLPFLATDCSYERWDVRDAKNLAKVEVEVANTSAQIVLTENLFAAAYGAQSAAGRPFFTAGEVDLEGVMAFRNRGYGLNGAILTATGVKDHSAFCTEAAELLSGSSAPAGTTDAPASIAYMGGESRVAALSSGYAHVALAFEAPASSAVSSTVKHLLTLLGAESGVAGFRTKGLVGIYAGGAAPAGLVDSLCSALTATVSPGIIKRAKNMAKADALFAMDGGSKSLAEFMTFTYQESGSFTSPADVAKAYDAVTEAQVQSAMTAMLKSNPAMAAVGDISAVPYQAYVAQRLS